MRPFSSVLDCVDLGEASQEVLELARRVTDAPLRIVYVAPERIAYHQGEELVTCTMPGFEALDQEQTRRQERALRALGQPGDRTERHVGEPVEGILGLAKEADLVVLATHGRRGLDRALLGSVAEEVLRRCPVPVLTTRRRD